MFNIDDMLVELERKSPLSKEQLLEKIKAKQEELSGLVSMEGATHLVARELGVDLLRIPNRPIKIKDVMQGMRNLSIKGRVIEITDVREFEKKDGSKGKVCNLIITDGTGDIRIPIWDKQVDGIIKTIRVGDVILMRNAVARQNNFGDVELGLLKTSTLEKTEDDKSIPSQRVDPKKGSNRIYLKDAKEGFFEIKGNIVDVFKVNPVFFICPICRMKVEDKTCQTHGKIEPEVSLIVTGIIDDGTSSMRVVFFRDKAKEITELDAKNLQGLEQDEAINLIKEKVLGNEYVLKGRIQRNKIFDTLEMIVDDVKSVDIESESKALINEIERFKWM